MSVAGAPDVDREPASPIAYGRADRRGDRRSGHRDGRKRIPSLAEVTALIRSSGPGQHPTPYLEMLFSRALDMMEHERLWYAAATAPARAELAEVDSQIAAARDSVQPARLAQTEARGAITDADMMARHPAEERRSKAFLRARREAERERRIATADAAYQGRVADLHLLEERAARLADSVHNRLSIARMRAVRISAYIAARGATYWEALVLVHRDGVHLAPLLPRVSPRLPEWVTRDDHEQDRTSSVASDDANSEPIAMRPTPDDATSQPPSERVTAEEQHIEEPGTEDERSVEDPIEEEPAAHYARPERPHETSPEEQPLPSYGR